MKIVYLAAGAANMYCGSCLHDNTLAGALRGLGADLLLVPTYTPLRVDEEDQSQHRVFYGGINVYLQQKSALFRHTPWLVDRLLDSPALLDLVAGRGASTDAEKLGDLAVSMLRGEEGRQRKELDKLVHWLKTEARPDLVHLSNSMLAGMAREIRRQLRVPVVCTLSGEDIFLEKLIEPHYSQARQSLRERAADISAFVSLNQYYAEFMADYADIPRHKIHVIPHGLKLAGHSLRQPATSETFTIGYFARVCPDKGLHRLVEAFRRLAADPAMRHVRLRAAGYLGGGDREYLEEIRRQLASSGLADRFDYVGEVNRQQKIDFLHTLDVMSVPTVYRESKGISVLEAMANGVPVVLPAHGTFPELIDDTGGGLLCDPADPADLAEKIRQLVLDPARAAELGRRGHRAIHDRYHDRLMAERTLELYRRVVDHDRGSTQPGQRKVFATEGTESTELS